MGALISLCSFVMATYTCYLLAINISSLAKWDDALHIHQKHTAPWKLFQIGTTSLVITVVFDAYIRFEYEGAIALGVCIMGAQVAWWYYIYFLRQKMKDMERI